ncbi:hypothetical protein EVA_03733 [gut metagenome]|uniref:Uncharacterized protein n=1 Tax=gut metagenome TaxID=749906 RepID=J9GYC0_9ZZZZ
MIIDILDDDLRDLIIHGTNSGKYKKIARDKKFVKKLTDIYNLMKSVEHVSRLRNYSFLHYEQLKHISLSSSPNIQLIELSGCCFGRQRQDWK